MLNDSACLEAVASLVERGGKLDPRWCPGELRRIKRRLEELEAFKAEHDADLARLRGSVAEKLLDGKIVFGVGLCNCVK